MSYNADITKMVMETVMWTKEHRKKYAWTLPAGHCSSELTDEMWALLEPLIPERKSDIGRPRPDMRRVLEALYYILVTGSQWRNLPPGFLPWSMVKNWFYGWQRDGTWEKMHNTMLEMMRKHQGREPTPTAGSMDSQTTKTVEGGPRGYDGAKKIAGRKRHVLSDTEGNVVAVHITAANIQDRDAVPALLEEAKEMASTLVHVWADGGYTGEDVQKAGEAVGVKVEIVKRTDNMKGFKVVPRRWVSERTFSWLGRCRRLAKDFERTVESVKTWILLASMRLMLRRLTRATA